MVLLFSVSITFLQAKNTRVYSVAAFNSAYATVQAGDTITLANQVWENSALVFSGRNGTAALPICIEAETYGNVVFTGNSYIKFSGNYIIVKGIIFRNAVSSGSNGLIEFRSSSSAFANYSRVTKCAFVDCNPPAATTNYQWLSLYGTYNRVDHCFFRNKNHAGPSMAVVRNGHVADFHRIDSNYFGYRPALGVNGGETIRIGTSTYSLSASRSIVEFNYFEKCNGEMEIISNKSCENIYRYNTFVECEGTITMRHGNRCEIYGNFILGNRKQYTGGIRIIGEDHKVFNNYISGTTGDDARSAISLYEGVVITDSTDPAQLALYFPVKNAVVAHNTLIDCKYNFTIGAGAGGSNIVTPSNITVANNVFRGMSGNITSPMVIQKDTAENLVWTKNYISGTTLGISPTPSGISMTDPKLSLSADGLYRPTSNSPLINVAQGSLPYITIDVDGQMRDASKDVGADEYTAEAVLIFPMDQKSAGPGNVIIESGNWTDTTIWLYKKVPQAGEDVLIASGDTVVFDAATQEVGNLRITGIFQFSKTTSGRALMVDGSLQIDPGGTCSAPARASSGAELLHTLTIKKDLVNNGTFDMRGGSGTTAGMNTCNAVNITFSGTSHTNIHTGPYSSSNNEFNGITFNKTGGAAVYLHGDIFTNTAGSVLPPNINFTQGIVYTGTNKFVVLSNGATVSSGTGSSYVLGKFGRSFSSAGGSKTFVIGDSSAYRPITLHTSSSGITSGHYLLAEVIHANANNGNSSFPDSVDAVSSTRYFRTAYYQNTSSTPQLTVDYFTLSYGGDDGVIVGSSSIRTAYSTDNRYTWLGAGPVSHIAVIGAAPTNIQSSILNTNLPVLANNDELFLSIARASGGMGLSRPVSIVTKIQGLYRAPGFADDTLEIELRESISPYNPVYTKKILTENNVAVFTIADMACNGQYYLVIKHRNAIETWSGNTVNFNSGKLEYNMSDSPSRAFGNNLVLLDSAWCLYSGDVNNDGIVDFSDLTLIDNAAFLFATGYLPEDINGDGFVDFSDLTIVDNNAYIFAGVVSPQRQQAMSSRKQIYSPSSVK